MYICEECKKEFEKFQDKANHIRWKHLDNTEYIKNARKAYFEKVDEQVNGKWIYEDILCNKKNCNNIIHIKYRENKRKNKYFCSLKCSQSHKHSELSKKKQSDAIKKAWKNGIYNTDSFREKQSKNIKFSSKKEREIVNYFKTNYPNDEWKSGGGLYYRGEEISRDLYSNKLKICFEYDGIWHFKNIHNQLDKKQRKDKLLEEWCIENKYRLIRIDENFFINFEQLEKLFFENKEFIIKIGQRY
jgi:hypothetical protein